jgi:pilus assembly protein Flp/PilA
LLNEFGCDRRVVLFEACVTSPEPGGIFMTLLADRITSFLCDEDGATLAEYGLLLALILLVCLVAVASLGTKISSMYSAASTSI